MGDYDNGFMTSLGGHLLHELMHWDYLFQGVPGYDEAVKATLRGRIDDYDYETWSEGLKDEFPDLEWPEEPSNGYQPNNARELNGASEQENLGRRNADNYRWYSQSKYWSFRCKKEFGANEDYDQHSDDRLRWNLPH
jgi:hypothetical protein